MRPWLLVIIALVGAAGAQEHPVTLEKNFDPAGCASCHEDKTKGKNVHTAIQSGCPACHEITSTGDKTTIKLIAGKEDLCQTCHEQAKAESNHKPYAAGQCIFCHDPHTSDYAKQTRAATNALCQECHKARRLRKEDTQVAIFNQTIPVADFLKIAKVQPEMSHQFGAAKTTVPDPGHEGETMSCRSCHLPHTSSAAKLLRVDGEVKNFCSNCHDRL